MNRHRADPEPPPDPVPSLVTLRAYGPLGDFLPASRRGFTQARRIDGSPAVKDVVEAAGIPHPEVALVLVNGEPVGFERRLEPGDRVAVYPLFRSVGLGATVRPGPPPIPASIRRKVRAALALHCSAAAPTRR